MRFYKKTNFLSVYLSLRFQLDTVGAFLANKMFLQKCVSIFLLHIALVTCNLTSHHDDHFNINVICSSVETIDFKFIGNFTACAASNITAENFNTKIRHVHYQNGTRVKSVSIEAFVIKNEPNCKFMPMGLKKTFWNLVALNVQESGLMHIDQQDMKQFGSELLWIRLFETKLAALDGDLFDHNPNLVFVSFEGNALKYIDSQLFESFKQMKYLEKMNFNHCGCISKIYEKSRTYRHQIQIIDWKENGCNDTSAKMANLERINKRPPMSDKISIHDLQNDVDTLQIVWNDIDSVIFKNTQRIEEFEEMMEAMEIRLTNKFKELLDGHEKLINEKLNDLKIENQKNVKSEINDES